MTDTPGSAGMRADSRSRSATSATTTTTTTMRHQRGNDTTSIHRGGGGGNARFDTETENGGHENGHDFHQTSLPNSQQWLALRVHGGARNWPKLPNCFNSDR